MFVLKLSKTYRHPVVFTVPGDNGERQEIKFTAVYNRLTAQQIEELPQVYKDDMSMAKAVTASIDDIQDENADALVLDRLLEVPGAATALVMSYLDSLRDTVRKN